ncbi:MAG: segregation/condensation protein A [Candidatus Aenigmarchaeota archaeon]|nr:segregation/condensation protein A [Candidatus Aenigmarchaeota archaeon]
MDEEKLIRTIVTGADWQEVLSSIVIEHSLDPMNIDITKLSQEFMNYIHSMTDFNFRIPARFILVAAVLLTMKCEKILEEEEKQLSNLEKKEYDKLDIDVPLVMPPIKREPTRKVTLTELISAMSKVIDIKQKKERIIKIDRESPVISIQKAEDIEKRVEVIYEMIRNKGLISFSDIVHVWRRKDIIYALLPVLTLVNRDLIECDQEEHFKEIYIKLK